MMDGPEMSSQPVSKEMVMLSRVNILFKSPMVDGVKLLMLLMVGVSELMFTELQASTHKDGENNLMDGANRNLMDGVNKNPMDGSQNLTDGNIPLQLITDTTKHLKGRN